MAGTPVQVVTNSFVVKSLPTRTYYQYDVFNPADPKPQKRQRLIHDLQINVYPQVFTPKAVYDGNHLLYSSKVIETAVYRVHGSNQQAPRDAAGWYDITISRTAGKPIVPSDVNKLVQRGEATAETTTATNLLQLLLCQQKNQSSPNTGRAFYTPEDKQPLRGMAVELWRGFYQAVRPSVDRLLVTVDTTVAAFYMPGPLIEVCMAVLDVREVRRLALHSNEENFKKLERHLKKRLILVKTRAGQPPRTKTVHGLVPAPVGGYEFHPSESGPKTTVGEHYQSAHNVTLTYPGTIGIVTSGKGAPFKVVVPLELCAMIPGQLYKKKLPPDATASVVSFAALKPDRRLRTITSGNGGQQRSPVQDYQHSEYLVDAGMQIDQNPMTIRGRLLPPPPVVYQGRQVTVSNGAWNVVGARFYAPREMVNWGVINFDSHRINDQLVQKTIRELMNCCSQLGMNVAAPVAVRNGNSQNVKGSIEGLCRDLGGDAKKINMVIVLLPAKADDLRTRVKYLCDVEIGVRSQCLRESKLQRANNQYFNNVGLKLNARLGGSNSLVESPVLKELKSKPFMCFGADVAHPGPGANRPSVASLVWSHDMHGASYCATTLVQLPRSECITDLGQMFEAAVKMFGVKHKVPPANVFFFRDGVSEGEFAIVKKEEISQINKAFDRIWNDVQLKGPKPNLTFVVVGKRHHVSFFPPQQNAGSVGDKTGNCRAGLTVDAELANPQFPDFYLQSHSAIQGTSRSAHYTVLQDEVFKGNMVKLQELAFSLCHIYAKATRSVSIPAPVYYADLACARGKFHFDPTLDMDIEGSTTSGGGGVFTLDPWEKAFKPINDNVKGSMFFL
ncbi:Piwi domain-containing protein [Mycena galopus ATCC 62051]|nr:Piwi domain-containing protein [Mycena galopus ATCC 62051]